MKDMYDESYYELTKSHLDFKKNHLIFAKNIKKLYHPRKVLDIGCGTGSTVRAFIKIGIECYGIDISKNLLDKSPPSIRKNLSECDIKDGIPFENDYFDIIIADNVFEHLEDDDSALKECLRCLKKKGRIIIIVPKEKGTDPTHINHKPRKEWIRFFKRHTKIEEIVIDRKIYVPFYIPFEKSIRKSIYKILKPNFFILKKNE
jgi:ubiquinone/menaquinone biosynthesis C-methylase UbiE